jgi:hypothetical protein
LGESSLLKFGCSLVTASAADVRQYPDHVSMHGWLLFSFAEDAYSKMGHISMPGPLPVHFFFSLLRTGSWTVQVISYV